MKGLGLRCLAEAKDGAMWFGVDEGVRRYDGTRWTVYTPKEGVLGAPVNALCAARDGSVYAGTEQGISRFREDRWQRVFPSEGDLAWPTDDLTQARDGAVWAGTAWGALRIDEKGAVLLTTREMGAALRVIAPDVRISVVPDGVAPVRPWSRPSGDGIGVRAVESGMTSMRSRGAPMVVWAVASDGPGRALRVGDRILSVNGSRPVWVNDALHGPQGVSIRVAVRRGADTMEVTVPTRRVEGGYRDFSTYDVYEGLDGTMWFGIQNGEVVRYRPGAADAWRLFTDQDGMETGWGPRIVQTRDGIVWVVSNDGRSGVSRFDGKRWTHFKLSSFGGKDINTSIIETRDGVLWIGGFSLSFLRDEKWRSFGAQGIPWHRQHLLEASDGALWVAGLGQEAVRLAYGTTRWTTYEGLHFQCETPDGAQWFLSRDSSVVRYGEKAWTRYGAEDGLMQAPMALLTTRRGDLWAAGSHGGLAATARFEGGRWSLQTHLPFKGDKIANGVLAASDGSLWFGFGDDNGLLQFDPLRQAQTSGQAAWTRHAPPESPEGPYRIAQTGDGDVWAGGFFGLRRFDGQAWTVIADPEGLTSYIHAVLGTKSGGLWVGTRTYGVFRSDGRTWTQYDERNGLSGNQINALLRTSDGSIWAATNGGVSRFDGQAWVTYALPRELGTVSDEGLRQSRDGAVWINKSDFTTIRYEPHRVPPETEIAVSLDRVSQPGNTVLAWSGADPWRVTPDEELQFSYRLDGDAWSPFSEAKNHVFLSLPAGTHRFEVKARDRDFNEDPTPAAIRFTVLPPVWREPWFVGMVALLLSAVGLQTGRVVRRDRRLRESNAALSMTNRELFRANEDLKREIAERQRAEEERARLVSLGQMVAGVAHEISQPLSAISATAEGLYLRLEEGIAVSRGRLMEMMKHVVGLVERMVGTVEHLRVFSRDTSMEADVRFSVNEMIHSSLGLAGAQLRNHGVALQLDLAEELPPVSGHPHQMEQVMLNLLNNARDALDEKEQLADRDLSFVVREKAYDEPRTTNHEPVLSEVEGSRGREKRVAVRTRREGDWVVIEVEDNGTGIDEAHQARLFEPFFTTKRADRGTGIGLSICHAIVQKHGGRIACESRKGEGTTFRVGLPACET